MAKQTRRSVARARFTLKDKSERETLIFMTIRVNKKRVKWSTAERVNPKDWNVRTGRAIVRAGSTWARQINARLDDYARVALSLHAAGTHLHPDSFKQELQYLTGREQREVAGSQVDTTDFMRFCESVRDLRKDSTDTAHQTWRNINTNVNTLREFVDDRYRGTLRFEDVDDLFVGELKKHLFRAKGHRPQTVAKMMMVLKSMFNRAADRGLMVYDRRLKAAARQTFRKRPYPSLNYTELTTVLDLDLVDAPRLERVRDLFVIGVATAQRWSDYSSLTPDNFKPVPGGGYRYFVTSQKKTKSAAGGPVMSWAVPTLVKYGYIGSAKFTPIKISQQKFNLYLKEVMQMAIPDVTFKVYHDGEQVDHIGEDVPKWSEIASHTARRTAVGLLRSMGAPDNQIQKMTGHKSIAEMSGYDTRDAEALAVDLGKRLDSAWQRGGLKAVQPIA